jgi:asparagine synthase (glutamine-hydrolysing)
MVLTGEGGDELFAGYARYSGERFRKYVEWLPPSLGNLVRSGVERLPGLRRAKIAISALTLDDEASRFANWFPMFKDGMKEHLFRKQFLGLKQGVADLFRQHLEQCDAKTPLDRMLYVDCKLWLADYLLLRGDKLTMANSLEARVPLLDHHVVEFAASLPESMKLRGRQRKYLLRQVARRLLPGDIIDRKKQGFPIPIEAWLRREAAPMLHDLLNEGSVQRRGYFQWNLIDKLIQEHTSGFADHSTELWGLISLEMWFQRFIDSPVQSPDTVACPSASSGVNRPSDLVIGDHH